MNDGINRLHKISYLDGFVDLVVDFDEAALNLDNCCFNRPYDDQSYLSISLETQAKLHVQDLIRNGKLELATSYMLVYENKQNPYEMRRTAIAEFIDNNAAIHVSEANMDKVTEQAKTIMSTGVKFKDACHVACAIMAK